MMMRLSHAACLGLAVTAFAISTVFFASSTLAARPDEKVFELRKYVANEGKLDALHARFRDHTNGLFQKHGMTLVGYWTPTDPPGEKNTLIYILAHSSRDAAKKSWKAFQDDPEWKKAYRESHVNGPLVAKVESTYMRATDYSPIK